MSTPAGPRPGTPSPRRPSVLFEVGTGLVLHAVLVTSLFFLFRGHNAPGGGFIAGLVAGTALVLAYLAGDTSAGRRAAGATPRPGVVLGVGLLLAAGTAVAPWLGGGQVLESGYSHPHVPVLGGVSLASVLIFDIGVYLVVVGLVLAVLSTLGEQAGTSLAPGGEEDR
ncbi:multisubunit Na+/H+ antiporter MnhB subunit [Kineococcus xinjiangensis]|uniref:Multisubunit Na+/H+ antiporter MnhB subunit n=1 Tax=Kineococcus xinjiangensis TaxID=512762 RepID=A0A2S6IGS1_9ACTN|nr:MnhB domain-containing protein [Kineococcus xinjiangensis]PPK93415.1 multisubunit Na+/H+ antiporter MnhB subunit [Kineococcus xinjiangensis]